MAWVIQEVRLDEGCQTSKGLGAAHCIGHGTWGLHAMRRPRTFAVCSPFSTSEVHTFLLLCGQSEHLPVPLLCMQAPTPHHQQVSSVFLPPTDAASWAVQASPSYTDSKVTGPIWLCCPDPEAAAVIAAAGIVREGQPGRSFKASY